MDHTFFVQIALVPLIALGCGLIFERLKQPAVLGYIVAGILLGPSALDLVKDRSSIEHLAELGVQMLLFLIGMELSLKSFMKVWHIALMCTILQIGSALGVVYGLGLFIEIPDGLKLVLSFALGLSSTAVAVKMLERIDELKTDVGRTTIGVLIAQDLAIVPMILILRSAGAGGGFGTAVALKIAFSLCILGAVIWFFSRKEEVRLNLIDRIAHTPDLRPVAALVFCFGTATIAGVLGLSSAYGAFLGGLILGNTADRHTMVESTQPIQTVLMMVFFLSIGLLMDIRYIMDHFVKVIVLLLFITVIKTALNISILRFLKQQWSTAFLTGLVLAQMGEFSFLLTQIGLQESLISKDGGNLVISLAALSLALSPFWMNAARRLHNIAPEKLKSGRQIMDILYGKQMKALQFIAEAMIIAGQKLLSRSEKKEEPRPEAETTPEASEATAPQLPAPEEEEKKDA